MRTRRPFPTLLLLALVVPAAVRADALKAGEIVLVRTADDAGFVQRPDGTRLALPLAVDADVHAFAASGERWWAAAVEHGRRLVVLEGAGDAVRTLPAPEVPDDARLAEPTPLVDAGGLHGLAWIEGEARRQSVRAALWSAKGWRTPVTVAAPGPGSQMALTAVRLDDGSWLFAWAAFDGRDDEIRWSRWRGGEASVPERLGPDNAVPDVTPRLHAVPGGALAAWSRYDGNDYRLHLARFDGGAWTQPESVGPAGSLYPGFEPGPDGPVVVYLRADPRAWVAGELDAHGVIRRQAEVPTHAVERPLVRVTRESVSMSWVDGEGAEQASRIDWRDVR